MSGSRRQSGAARPRSSGQHLPVHGSSREGGHFPVVGIGASAGGLDACRKFVSALPARNRMAFILVQHLDPTHESMMVDLLSGHTAMTVLQAANGMPLEPDHLYVIPPGTYLSVDDETLHLSPPQARHGARLPFDFLLHSLANDVGARAICVVLSGTGADGTLGLKSIKEKCGLVIAQDPDEADYDGMPHNAIMTGAVDLVLPTAKIPEAIIRYQRRMALTLIQNGSLPQDTPHDGLHEIIDLLRVKTAHDFSLYKPGTLQRRIERRMAMTAIETEGLGSVSRRPARRYERARPPRQGFADQRHELLPRREGVRSPGGKDRARPRSPPAARSSIAHLDRRVQHGRRDLFPRHAVPRANHSAEA